VSAGFRARPLPHKTTRPSPATVRNGQFSSSSSLTAAQQGRSIAAFSRVSIDRHDRPACIRDHRRAHHDGGELFMTGRRSATGFRSRPPWVILSRRTIADCRARRWLDRLSPARPTMQIPQTDARWSLLVEPWDLDAPPPRLTVTCLVSYRLPCFPVIVESRL